MKQIDEDYLTSVVRRYNNDKVSYEILPNRSP